MEPAAPSRLPTPRATPAGGVGVHASQRADVARILRIRVPVIVLLAQRKMNIGLLRRLSPGTILEFEKGVDEPIELLVNNRAIAHGEPVKVGEKLGLSLNAIADKTTRILSMGR